MFQDSKGNVWLATGGGLSKFNGIEFTNYTSKFGLNYTRLLSVCKDDNNNIWIGSSHGLNVFDGDQFLSCKDSLLGTSVLAIEKATNNCMWVLTDSGLNIANSVNNKIKFRRLPYKLKYKNFSYHPKTNYGLQQNMPVYLLNGMVNFTALTKNT